MNFTPGSVLWELKRDGASLTPPVTGTESTYLCAPLE
jgi:hypothetical protein